MRKKRLNPLFQGGFSLLIHLIPTTEIGHFPIFMSTHETLFSVSARWRQFAIECIKLALAEKTNAKASDMHHAQRYAVRALPFALGKRGMRVGHRDVQEVRFRPLADQKTAFRRLVKGGSHG